MFKKLRLKKINIKKFDVSLNILSTLENYNYFHLHQIIIKGKFGEKNLMLKLPKDYVFFFKQNFFFTTPKSVHFKLKAFSGLYYKILLNSCYDLSFLYKKKIKLNGVGFRGFREKRSLLLSIGFSYMVEFFIPVGIEVIILDDKKQKLLICGFDRQLVNIVVHEIKKVHPVDPYCGQGILTFEEQKNYRKKPGKRQAQT